MRASIRHLLLCPLGGIALLSGCAGQREVAVAPPPVPGQQRIYCSRAASPFPWQDRAATFSAMRICHSVAGPLRSRLGVTR